MAHLLMSLESFPRGGRMKMRRFLSSRPVCGAAGLVVLGLARQGGAANLLVNPGFEAPVSAAQHDQVCTGWTFQFDCERANFFNHTPGGARSIWIKTFEPLGGG